MGVNRDEHSWKTFFFLEHFFINNSQSIGGGLPNKQPGNVVTRLQVLNYMVQKWHDLKRKGQLGTNLPVVIPVVIYHGKGRWNYSLRFSDLFELPCLSG